MPLYEFKCYECGEEYEELVPMGKKEYPACPACKSTRVEKKISACASSGTLCGTSGFS